jgi:hypothetical protein
MAIINTWRTARKTYWCTSGRWSNEHGSVINPGDRYVRSAQTPNDEFGGPHWSTMLLCADCGAYYSNIPADPKAVSRDA